MTACRTGRNKKREGVADVGRSGTGVRTDVRGQKLTGGMCPSYFTIYVQIEHGIERIFIYFLSSLLGKIRNNLLAFRMR